MRGLTLDTLASGDGWSVANVLCGSGPRDCPYEERHERTSIAIVAEGSFEYHAAGRACTLTPGSLLLGNTGQRFECSHRHGIGDRCISFAYDPEYFDRLAFDAGARSAKRAFPADRVPPLRELSGLVARALTGNHAWDEFSVELAAFTVQLVRQLPPLGANPPASSTARIAKVIRLIERHPEDPHDLATLARHARLSDYHFLRVFQSVTGLTPHQYVLRTRLREAAKRLASSPARILDIALDCGFGDVSNFNRAFRAEFGLTPRMFRSESA